MSPAPGPISTTVRPERSPNELAMRWTACASSRKFCPSLGLEGILLMVPHPYPSLKITDLFSSCYGRGGAVSSCF